MDANLGQGMGTTRETFRWVNSQGGVIIDALYSMDLIGCLY